MLNSLCYYAFIDHVRSLKSALHLLYLRNLNI